MNEIQNRIEEIRCAVEAIARCFVERKDLLSVTAETRGPQVYIRVRAAQTDMPSLVGKRGTNFDAWSELVWNMGNRSPRLKTQLMKLEQISVDNAVAMAEADPSDLLTVLLTDMGIPSLAAVTTGQMRAIMERAGRQAEDLRMYLLTMRADVPVEVKRLLERR